MTEKYTKLFGVMGYHHIISTEHYERYPRDRLLDDHRRHSARAIGEHMLKEGIIGETLLKYEPGMPKQHPMLTPYREIMEHRVTVMRPEAGSLHGLVRSIQVEAIRDWQFYTSHSVISDAEIAAWCARHIR